MFMDGIKDISLFEGFADKARRQVTNILSDGARKNKWYRGQLGYYSMSKASAKARAS